MQPIMRGNLVFATDFVVDLITFIKVPGRQFPRSELRILWGTVEGRHTNPYRDVTAAPGLSQDHTQPIP